MITRIWLRNGWRNIDPAKTPKDSRELNSFLIYNNAPQCFMRMQGQWYKVNKDGTRELVSRTLYLLSFREWLEIALK